jgi:hypothetical protein
VLSGELFNGSSRSFSPVRSPSPDTGWHDDEIDPEVKRRIEQGYDYDSDDQRRDAQKAKNSQAESIGMGPGRTGVKGVIRDRNEAKAMERDQRSLEVDEMQRRLENSHLGGKSFLEEEREKATMGSGKVDLLVMKELEAAEERRKDIFGRQKDRQFGHLREVGFKGFVAAVEKERAVWVVVHIYEPVNFIPRPFSLLAYPLLFHLVPRTVLFYRRYTVPFGATLPRHKVPACARSCPRFRVYNFRFAKPDVPHQAADAI